jgi:hypothetical protein
MNKRVKAQPLVHTCHVWLVRESKCFFEEITAIWALLPEEAYTQHSIFYLQDNEIKTHKIDGPHRWALMKCTILMIMIRMEYNKNSIRFFMNWWKLESVSELGSISQAMNSFAKVEI